MYDLMSRTASLSEIIALSISSLALSRVDWSWIFEPIRDCALVAVSSLFRSRRWIHVQILIFELHLRISLHLLPKALTRPRLTGVNQVHLLDMRAVGHGTPVHRQHLLIYLFLFSRSQSDAISSTCQFIIFAEVI